MRLLIYHTLLLTLLLTMGCGKDDEPASTIPTDAVYDIVTLVESTAQGSVFEMRKSDDSPVITYTSTYDLASASTHIDPGDRIIICYKPKEGAVYTSGPIRLYGYVTLANTAKGVSRGTAGQTGGWSMRPVRLTSMWRTGVYLNIEAQIYLHEAQKPEVYELVVDEATVNDPYPELYIIYHNKDGNDGDNAYNVTASFNVQELWDLTTCQGLNVNYATKTGSQRQTFSKTGK